MLTCSLNALTKLDLTGCTALESLDCSDNAPAALDLWLHRLNANRAGRRQDRKSDPQPADHKVEY